MLFMKFSMVHPKKTETSGPKAPKKHQEQSLPTRPSSIALARLPRCNPKIDPPFTSTVVWVRSGPAEITSLEMLFSTARHPLRASDLRTSDHLAGCTFE